MRRLAPALLSLPLLLAPLALSGCGHAGPPPASAPSPMLEKPLPDFQRRTVGGESLKTEGLRGKVLVVKFFAKYCEPCKRTLPAVEHLHQKSPDVAFVGVAEDESESDVRELIGTYGLTFPVIHDQGNVLSGRFRVTEMPVTFVIDAKGTIRWVGGPDQSEEDLARAISAYR